jgi:hypothetical protein
LDILSFLLSLHLIANQAATQSAQSATNQSAFSGAMTGRIPNDCSRACA